MRFRFLRVMDGRPWRARRSGRKGWWASVMVCLVSLCLCHAIHAHHGRDFILVQDSAIPERFHGVAMAGYSWTREGDQDTFSTEPGVYVGLTSSLAFGLTAGFSDEAGNWSYTGVTPQFIVSILPATGPRNFRIGFWTGYEFAEDLSSSPSVLTTGQSGNNPGSGPDARQSAAFSRIDRFPAHAGSHGPTPQGQEGSGRRGIHRHGESGWYSRLIFEADVADHTRMVLNFISFVSGEGAGPGFGYAAGLRHELNHDLSLGMEAIGEFRSYGSSHEVLLTAMVGLPRHLALRFGAGGGLTNSSPDFSMHAGLLWRF